MQTFQSDSRNFDASVRGLMDNLQPRTDGDSRHVMVAAKRNDELVITNVIRRERDSFEIPNRVTVVQRQLRYYGPELLVHAEVDGIDKNYLINAPGPDADLHLWGGVIAPGGKRENWVRIAEITASLGENQPNYEICDQCGDPIQNLDHEQVSLMGDCRR